MTIEGAISSGLNGFNAFANQINNISENLANTQTAGFKRVDSNFHDMINGEKVGLPSPNSVVGYYSPVSVRSLPSYRVDTGGSLTSSEIPTSFSVTGGEGLVPVAATSFSNNKESFSADVRYTRAADFAVDKNNYFVNSQGQALMAVPEDVPGSFKGTFDTRTPADIVPVNQDPAVYRTMKGSASGLININVNFPSIAQSDNPVDPPGTGTTDQTLSVPFFDEGGYQHTVDLIIRKIAYNNENNTTQNNKWSIISAKVPNDINPTGQVDVLPVPTSINFDGNGRYVPDVPPSPIKITIPNLNDNLPGGQVKSYGTGDISLDMSNSTEYAGQALEVRDIQDKAGLANGTFVSSRIDSSGNVLFKYSNGVEANTYRISLATFRNPNLLDRITGTTFGANPDFAGKAAYSWSGGDAGSITPLSVEASNVDLATELTKMIGAQQAYSSNSKVISVGMQMLQTAIELKT